MAYTRRAAGADRYDFPVELVWRALTGDSTGHLIDPLDEETFENTDPKPGTVYTRRLEVETNKRFSFQIKSTMYTATWTVELSPDAPCRTGVTVREVAEFPNLAAFAACRFGFGLRHELRLFMREMERKLENYEKKLKLDKR